MRKFTLPCLRGHEINLSGECQISCVCQRRKCWSATAGLEYEVSCPTITTRKVEVPVGRDEAEHYCGSSSAELHGFVSGNEI